MVDFQVTRLVPHPKSEIIYDYQWIKPLPNQCTMIRVAVLHRKAIEHHLSILSQAGLRPRAIQLDTESIENILPEPQANAALLEIDFNQSHLVFIQDGKVLFSRSIPIGAKDFNAKEPFNISDFSAEIEASIALFPVEHEKSKAPLFIFGASSALELLERPLRAQLKMEIQKLFLPLKAEVIIGKENLPQVSFESLLSLLKIPSPESAINLLPQDIYQTYGKTAYLTEVKKLSLVVGVVLLLGALTFMNELRLEEKHLKSLKLKIKSIEKTASELESLRNKITFLQDHMDRRGNCMKVISSLFENIPEEIHFKTIGYDLSKINLRGYSPNLSKIFEFASILEKNPLFQKIETKYARQLSNGKQEMAEFYIECTLAPSSAGGKTNA
jgi:Tfp pilus assembly protein PilN